MRIYLKGKRLLSVRYRVVRSNILLNKESGDKMMYTENIALIPKSNWEKEMMRQLSDIKDYANLSSVLLTDKANTTNWWEN